MLRRPVGRSVRRAGCLFCIPHSALCLPVPGGQDTLRCVSKGAEARGLVWPVWRGVAWGRMGRTGLDDGEGKPVMCLWTLLRRKESCARTERLDPG